jgi:succinate dehydrogenase/fumarate reductase flavoprotein subunit
MDVDMEYRLRECDVLVVGGGGAGALAALEAATDKNLKILVIARGPLGQSGLTPTGNGGTAMGGDQFFNDMVTGGRFLNEQNLVKYMADEMSSCVENLKRLGVPVTQLRPSRICVPGPDSVRVLRKRILEAGNVELLEDMLVTGLLKSGGRMSGAVALDLKTGEFFAIRTSAIVLATGGMTGELYPRTSNNPFGVSTDASGAGHMMAFHAGAEIIDPEMINFVPIPVGPLNMNIRYFPDFWAGPYQNNKGEIVESDVEKRYIGGSYSWQVVRSLFKEMREGRGPVFVDHRGLNKPIPGSTIKTWENRRRLIKMMGIDPRENKVELMIGSHFCTGGIRVNEKTESTVPGLFAAGEIMGGVHGSLRIPGFSFTQWIVFGFEAGRRAAEWVRQAGDRGEIKEEQIAAEKKKVFRFFQSGETRIPVSNLKSKLQKVMETYVFVERNNAGLRQALSEIDMIKEETVALRVPDFKRFNLEWMRTIEFQFLIEAAELVVEGALMREESRGFHYRTDFPTEDNSKWLCHTMFKIDQGCIKKSTVPVDLGYQRPEA